MQFSRKENIMTASTLEELFAADIDSISSTEPAIHAKRRMDTSEARSLLVIDEGRLVGIIRRNTLIKESHDSLERPVADFMSTDVPKFRRDQSPREAHDSLSGDINTEQVPVLDEDGNLVGVVNRNALTGAMEPVGGTTHGEHAPSQFPLEDGMTVKDADGSKLGTLAEADFKADGGVEFLIVEHGLVFKKQKRLPGDVISGVEDGDLVLAIGSTEFGMIKDLDED
jgi:CBS domain-containing protein